MTLELRRPLAAEAVPPGGREVLVEANPAECAVLARRMGLPALLSLNCAFRLIPVRSGVIAAEGHLKARLVQICVVTLEEFETELDERFTVRFLPQGTERDDPDPDAEDEIPYHGGVLDLGEAAAEQLALGLDPYPRKPDAVLPPTGSEQDEEAVGPFAGLVGLKPPP
ncbi:MAG: DUF177 domain-containing protein [Acidisphaera sp.]|nr:DUF177 domain-containing protein [Acidisphaera sp.]